MRRSPRASSGSRNSTLRCHRSTIGGCRCHGKLRFLAGQCFVGYRRRGGARRSPLPDFYIGAHAAIAGLTLLTRDARRYRSYFPTLQLVAP